MGTPRSHEPIQPGECLLAGSIHGVVVTHSPRSIAVFTVCALAYSTVLMMHDWPYRWVNLATGWLSGALTEAGLSRREREAHTRLRRATFLTPEYRQPVDRLGRQGSGERT
jgi:hypothetical protein